MADKRLDKSFKGFSTREKSGIIILAILIIISAILGPILISSSSLSKITTSKDYRVGELSDETILSPVDFSYIDEVATKALIESEKKKILPHFSHSASNSILMRSRADDFQRAFDSEEPQGREFLIKYELEDPDNVIGRFEALDFSERRMLSRLIDECIISIINEGLLEDSDVRNIINEGWDEVVIEKTTGNNYGTTVEKVDVSDLLTKKYLSSYILKWISRVYPQFTGETISLIVDGVELLAISNVTYDQFLTESLINEAEDKVAPVLISVSKGSPLLEIDTIVTEQQLRTIDEINKSSIINISITKTLADFIFITVITISSIYLLFGTIPYKYRKAPYTIMILTIILIVQTIQYFFISYIIRLGFSNIDAFLPIFISPILATAITNKRRDGLIVGAFQATLLSIWPTSSIVTPFYIIISIAISIINLKFGKDRIEVLYQCLLSALYVIGVTVLFSLMQSASLIDMLWSIGASALNILAAYIVMSVVLPILENKFNIPTGFRLHELSFTDTPALNRLNQVALGTYNHVKNVSDMAYAAAKAIGANAELARVGALYHDIGKSEHPEYFIENQSGKNAHDDISSTLSAAIIKSHVKIGVEKGKEIGLPQEVIDIIGEHHGNDLIKFFYNEAMKNNKIQGATVSEEDFRYSGKIPSTPESAIVMLADCVEAATRTIKNPNLQKYDKFISTIISDKIGHNQLNNSRLTITDLNLIKDAFIHQLLGRDHHRIEYDNNR